MPDPSPAVSDLAARIVAADHVVALTGAGTSVPSGIPDFRSPGTGLWAGMDPMQVAHIDAWRRDPQRFWAFYGERFHVLDGKRPNPAHEALAALERAGRLDVVLTQNIDGLHRAAGTRELVELHGTVATSRCLQDGQRLPLHEVRRRLDAAPDGVPRCDAGHPLKPDVVLFGEQLDERAMQRASSAAAGADVLLCVGTSLEVHPVAGLPELTAARGGGVVLVTQGPTPWDRRAALKLDGDVAEELDALRRVLGA